MADGAAASVVVHTDADDQASKPQTGIPEESAKQTDKAETCTEKPDEISSTGNSGDGVLPRETLEGCPTTVTPVGFDETGPGEDSIIPVELEPVENSSHANEAQPAVIDTHSANVTPNQSDTENTPNKGCLMKEDVTEIPTQVPTHSQTTKDSKTETSIGESNHRIASSCDVNSHTSVSQNAVHCENGACDGGGVEKSLTETGIVNTSESTPHDVESSMSNVSLSSHNSSSRATGLTSESFTGSESGLEYESDSYETGSTESSATATSRSDTSSSSVASPSTKSTQKRVEKVINHLSESEAANSEALDEIHGAIRDTINATMNVLDSDPPSTSSNDSEASPARHNRNSHQKNGTVSNDTVKSLPQDNHTHSCTPTPSGDACLEQSDVKRYSDNSEELLSELSAELDLVGQTGSIETPNGIASQIVSSLPEFKRLQDQLESVTKLCGRQQLELDRLRVEKQQGVANLELIYQAQIKELERTISKQDVEVRHVKEKLTSHDAAAKRAVGTLQEQLKLRVDQLTKMYRESVEEKDNMVMKYAQAEQRNIELADRMAKMDAARREFLKEKELAVSRFRSVVAEKQRLQDLLDAKNSETVAFKRELERLRDQVTSSDIKVKWVENKLKAEVESHKETRGRLEDHQKRLRQAKEETEQIRRNCQAMILTYQDSEEIKSNSLDTQLRAKEELLQKLKLDKASEQEQNRLMSTELNHLKVKHSELLEELHTYKDKVQCQETERLVQEHTLDKFRETLQAQKHTNHTMKERLQQLENTEQQLLDEQATVKELKEQVSMLEESNTDLQTNMESCGIREIEHLEFTQKISDKNARIQSENITLSSTLDSLREEREELRARSIELQDRVDHLEHELAQEQEERKTENDSLTSRLAVKEKQVDELMTQFEDEKDENRTLKRRHAANTKDVMRQFQQAKRRLEAYEHSHGDHDSIGSNASSNGSFDTLSTQQPIAPHSRASSQEPTPLPPPQEEPFVEVIEIDKQMLLEKIVRLQKSHARKNEKIEFMEDHIQRLIREVQKKARIIQSYVLREDAGSLAPASMDVNKALLSRHGGIMASVFSSHSQDGTLTLDLSLEINRKLQAVVEDVLLKNITLKENIDTLGTEIARLSQENRQLQLQLQGAPLVNSNT